MDMLFIQKRKINKFKQNVQQKSLSFDSKEKSFFV